MADEPQDAVAPLKPADSLRMTVATMLKDIVPGLKDRIADAVVERETNKQVDAAVKAIDLLKREQSELYKVSKADITSYNKDGSIQTEAFSKEQLKKREDQQKKVDKLTNLINKALEKGEFNDLYEMVK